MSTNDILTGLGLVIVIALGCELVADRTRLPAIVLLLPAGFIAGALTNDVHPSTLFGAAFQPLVSLGVGLILFEAGLRLRLDEMRGGARRVVMRLIGIGVVVTIGGLLLAVQLLFGLGWGSSLVLATVLVVSGPTVVLPLLEFVRPPDRVRAVLKWEGVLIELGRIAGARREADVDPDVGGRPGRGRALGERHRGRDRRRGGRRDHRERDRCDERRHAPTRAQEFLITIPSRMLATLSVASMAASRRSNRSFQRITTIGSMPPSNREATASRVMRSPSFSSRLTSTV
jgi:hypothetical protein